METFPENIKLFDNSLEYGEGKKYKYVLYIFSARKTLILK